MNKNESKMATNSRSNKKAIKGNKYDTVYLRFEFILTPAIMIIVYVFFRVYDIFIIQKNLPFLLNDSTIYQFIRVLDLILLLITIIFILPMIANSKYIHKYLTMVIVFLLAFIGFDFLSFYFYFACEVNNKNILFSLILDELWFIISCILFFISVLQNNDIHYLKIGSDIVSINFKSNNILINKSNFLNNIKIK